MMKLESRETGAVVHAGEGLGIWLEFLRETKCLKLSIDEARALAAMLHQAAKVETVIRVSKAGSIAGRM